MMQDDEFEERLLGYLRTLENDPHALQRRINRLIYMPLIVIVFSMILATIVVNVNNLRVNRKYEATNITNAARETNREPNKHQYVRRCPCSRNR